MFLRRQSPGQPASARRRFTARVAALVLVALGAIVSPPAATKANADLVTDTQDGTIGAAQLDGSNAVYWSQTTVDPACSSLGICVLHRFFQAIPEAPSTCDLLPPQWCLNASTSSSGTKRYYKISSGFDRQFEPNCGCYGPVTEWTVTMSSEDWYDYPNDAASNVYVNGSCQQHFSNVCSSDSHGAFWDSGKGASTDWDNQVIQENCGDLCPSRQKQPWIRTWLYTNGNVSFASGM